MFSFAELISSGFVLRIVGIADTAVWVLNESFPAPEALSLYTRNFDRRPLHDCHFDDRSGSEEARGRGGLGEYCSRKVFRTADWND
jgi:hypothetical protein